MQNDNTDFSAPSPREQSDPRTALKTAKNELKAAKVAHKAAKTAVKDARKALKTSKKQAAKGKKKLKQPGRAGAAPDTPLAAAAI